MTPEVKCEHCGTVNPAEETRCRMCGRPLAERDQGTEVCPGCGAVHARSSGDTCISCGWNFGAPKRPPEKTEAGPEACEHWSELPAHTHRTAMIDMAGILILLAGALGLTHALLAALPETGDEILTRYENIIPAGEFLNSVIRDYAFVSALMFVAGILTMGLSMSVFKRTSLWLSVAGAVFGIIAIGFLIGAFFAVVGLILLAASKREFLLECR